MAYRSTILTIADPTMGQLSAFKTAAAVSVTDDDLESKLAAWLKEGMIRVQQYYGKTLLAGTMQVEVDAREDNIAIELEGTVNAVTSVVDGDGNALEYTKAGKLIYPAKFSECVTITYTTKVNASDALALQGMAERYALCRYDGDSEEEAAKAVMGGRYVW